MHSPEFIPTFIPPSLFFNPQFSETCNVFRPCATFYWLILNSWCVWDSSFALFSKAHKIMLIL